MDIFISAPQGSGKTHLAQQIIKGLLPGNPRLVEIDDPATLSIDTGEAALNIISTWHRPIEGIVFDGCLITPTNALKAVALVKTIRKHGSPNAIAIYIEQGGALVLTDNYCPVDPRIIYPEAHYIKK